MESNTAGNAEMAGKSSTGLAENVAGLLCYFWIVGLIFMFIEKESRFVKFHGWQAVLLGAAVFVISFILPWLGSIGGILSMVLMLGYLVVSVLMMIKAYGNERVKLPVIGDIAEKQAYGA